MFPEPYRLNSYLLSWTSPIYDPVRCFGCSGLDKNEVDAISEDEHIPEIAAAALANYLLKQPNGGAAIRTMIIDDIHKSLDAGRVGHGRELFMALRHFLDEHPEARIGTES